MDNSGFDRLARSLGVVRNRRVATALLGALAALPTVAFTEVDAKKKKKKKKGKGKPKGGSPVCTPQCSGCGGGDGCGGTCGCGANQLCDAGTCRTCDVTCTGDSIACGSALNQRLADGGTIVVCPGRYQGNFTVGTAKVIGAGQGDNPATSTILDAAGSGGVVTVAANASTELTGLRITGGKATGTVGGGIRQVSNGDLRITSCTVIGNKADIGGGINVNGAFRLTNSTVSDNTAYLTGGLDLNGVQPKYLTGSVISGNKSTNSVGGGIRNFENGNAVVTIVDTTISGNSANGAGGGVHNAGIITFNAGSRVINNTATTAGGIANTGTVNLNLATVSGNTAPQCSGVTGC